MFSARRGNVTMQAPCPVALTIPTASSSGFGGAVQGTSYISRLLCGWAIHAPCGLETAPSTSRDTRGGAVLPEVGFRCSPSIQRDHRPVISVARWTLKVARNPRGRRCNLYEARLFQRSSLERRQLLCPVLWSLERGCCSSWPPPNPWTFRSSTRPLMQIL